MGGTSSNATNETFSTTGITPFAHYLAQCGGVQSLAMVNAGTTSYTNPTFTRTDSGPGTGLVVANGGVGTTASGIIAYTITNAGSGYTQSFMIPIPNPASGPFSQAIQACAYVTVTNNVVTSVLPVSGSQLAYGTEYTGTTITGVSLPGSGAFGDASGVSWALSPVPGSGLVVTGHVGNYVIAPDIEESGTGFVSPPVFAITDPGGSGTGATCVPVMTGPSPSDTLTFTAPAGLFGTAVPTPPQQRQSRYGFLCWRPHPSGHECTDGQLGWPARRADWPLSRVLGTGDDEGGREHAARPMCEFQQRLFGSEEQSSRAPILGLSASAATTSRSTAHTIPRTGHRTLGLNLLATAVSLESLKPNTRARGRSSTTMISTAGWAARRIPRSSRLLTSKMETRRPG